MFYYTKNDKENFGLCLFNIYGTPMMEMACFLVQGVKSGQSKIPTLVKFPFLGVSWPIGNMKFPGCLTYIWRKKNISLFVCMNIKNWQHYLLNIVIDICKAMSAILSDKSALRDLNFRNDLEAGRPERRGTIFCQVKNWSTESNL